MLNLNANAPRAPQASLSQVDFSDLTKAGLAETLALRRLWGESACFENAATFGEALVQGLFFEPSAASGRVHDMTTVAQLAQLLDVSYRHSETFRQHIDALADALAEVPAPVQRARRWDMAALLENDASLLSMMARADARASDRTPGDTSTGTAPSIVRTRAMLTDILSLLIDPSRDDTPDNLRESLPFNSLIAIWQELTASDDVAQTRFAFMAPPAESGIQLVRDPLPSAIVAPPGASASMPSTGSGAVLQAQMAYVGEWLLRIPVYEMHLPSALAVCADRPSEEAASRAVHTDPGIGASSETCPAWQRDIEARMQGAHPRGRRAMALLYLMALPAAQWARCSLKRFSKICQTLPLKRLVDYEGRKLRPAGWIALFEDWKASARWHAFNKARQRISPCEAAHPVCAEIEREYGVKGLQRCFFEHGRLQQAGRRLAEWHAPALSESVCRDIRERFLLRGARLGIARTEWPSWPFESLSTSTSTSTSTQHAAQPMSCASPTPSPRTLSPMQTGALSPVVPAASASSSQVCLTRCLAAEAIEHLPPSEQQALSHFHADYRGRLHTVYWLLDFMARPQQQRRRLELDEAHRLLVSRRQRSLSVAGWKLLLDVWRQSASCAALAQWQAQWQGEPEDADRQQTCTEMSARKRLSQYALPDLWFDVCLIDADRLTSFTSSISLTPFAQSLCGLPIRRSLCQRIRRTFRSCPKHISGSYDRLPQWPSDATSLDTIGERDDTERLQDLVAEPEPIDRLRQRVAPLLGPRNDVVRKINVLLMLNTLPLEEWTSCTLDTMLDIFCAGRTLSNYINHSRRTVRNEGWLFMLAAWRRRATHEALREVEARWLTRVRKSRSGFARLLLDVSDRYRSEPIDSCFDLDGQLTKRGMARLRIDETLPDETICRRIQLAFAGCPAMAIKHAMQIPAWPAVMATSEPALPPPRALAGASSASYDQQPGSDHVR